MAASSDAMSCDLMSEASDRSGEIDTDSSDLEEDSFAEAVVAAAPPFEPTPPDELRNCRGWDFRVHAPGGTVAFASQGGASARRDACAILRVMCEGTRRVCAYRMPADEHVASELVVEVARWAEGRRGEVPLDEFWAQRRLLLPSHRSKWLYAMELMRIGWSAEEADALVRHWEQGRRRRRGASEPEAERRYPQRKRAALVRSEAKSVRRLPETSGSDAESK